MVKKANVIDTTPIEASRVDGRSGGAVLRSQRNEHFDYEDWIRTIKERVQQARIKAMLSANVEQNLLYWMSDTRYCSSRNRKVGAVRLSSGCRLISRLLSRT